MFSTSGMRQLRGSRQGLLHHHGGWNGIAFTQIEQNDHLILEKWVEELRDHLACNIEGGHFAVASDLGNCDLVRDTGMQVCKRDTQPPSRPLGWYLGEAGGLSCKPVP